MKPILKIFIADDHPMFRRGVREALEGDAQLQVIGEAGQGEDALRQIHELRPSVAILDVQMPKLSGLQVARLLAEELPALHLILLTMHEESDLFDEAMDLGIRGYVLKESASEDLVKAVHCVVEGKLFVSPTISGLLLVRRDRRETLQGSRTGLETLTPAEQGILHRIANDCTSKEIADKLNISVRTVETHRQNISSKLSLSGTHSLLKFAYAHKSVLQDLRMSVNPTY